MKLQEHFTVPNEDLRDLDYVKIKSPRRNF